VTGTLRSPGSKKNRTDVRKVLFRGASYEDQLILRGSNDPLRGIDTRPLARVQVCTFFQSADLPNLSARATPVEACEPTGPLHWPFHVKFAERRRLAATRCESISYPRGDIPPRAGVTRVTTQPSQPATEVATVGGSGVRCLRKSMTKSQVHHWVWHGHTSAAGRHHRSTAATELWTAQPVESGFFLGSQRGSVEDRPFAVRGNEVCLLPTGGWRAAGRAVARPFDPPPPRSRPHERSALLHAHSCPARIRRRPCLPAVAAPAPWRRRDGAVSSSLIRASGCQQSSTLPKWTLCRPSERH